MVVDLLLGPVYVARGQCTWYALLVVYKYAVTALYVHVLVLVYMHVHDHMYDVMYYDTIASAIASCKQLNDS